jgi:hypothetical protein
MNLMYKAPIICPVCGSKMHIEVLRCDNCNSKLEGNFEMNEFASLSDENIEFLRLYLLNRGNLSKVSEILKLSYPTVLNKFNKLLSDLGYVSKEYILENEKNKNIVSKKKKIIDDLEKGLIKPKEAIEKLKLLKGEK